MKKKGMILVLAGLILLNGGCSSDQSSGGSADSAVMGRYIGGVEKPPGFILIKL